MLMNDNYVCLVDLSNEEKPRCYNYMYAAVGVMHYVFSFYVLQLSYASSNVFLTLNL